MSLVSFLKLLEHYIQCEIIKHKVTWVLIEFAKHPQGRVIISVDKREIFDVQKRQDVCSITLVNRNARVSC